MKKLLAFALALCMLISMTAAFAETTEAPATYTYHTYGTSLASNWNPHTWEVNADDTVLGYLSSPFVTMQVMDSENGIYQWIYEMATEVTDVTADHKDDLTTYGATLQDGKTIEDTNAGYVFEIKLNPNAKWEDGTPINADTYIYSMQQLLDPKMKNYRANLYYAGESAVAGGNKYYNSDMEGIYEKVGTKYASVADALAAGETVFIDVHTLWGAKGYTDAEGNEVAQYVSIADETVYGEAQGDAFSAKKLWETYGGAYCEVGCDYECAIYVKNEFMGAGFEVVGCYKVDEYTIRYVNQTYIDFNYFMTSLTSNWIVYAPKYEAGFDTTGTLKTTNYGTTVENTMSYGPYRLVSFEDGKQMVFVQNENWYGYEKQADGSLLSTTPYEVDGEHIQRYQTTSIVMDVMTDAAAKQAFLKGELSSWTPTAQELTTFATSSRLYKVDETYTMSFFFCCGLDKLQVMDESKGNTNSVVLSNVNFRKAMSLAINRQEYVAATEGYKPAFSLMNNLYHYDIYNDPTSSYRNSDEAMTAIVNLYGVQYGEGTPYATLKDAYQSINGYNLTEARALFTQACQELVEAGLYTAGDPIVVRMGWMKGPMDDVNLRQCEVLSQNINAAMEGTGFGPLTLEAIGNLSDRYGDVAKGEFAIGYGAWGGAAFYPFRNFQVYCDTEQYSIHEAGSWDPSTTNLTLKVNGEDVTMTWQDWSRALIGSGRYADADFALKLSVTAQMEEAYLKLYYRIPLAGTTACELLSYQVDYYTEDYNIMYGFGGLELMSYNYTDAEWAEYIAEQGGTLSYE